MIELSTPILIIIFALSAAIVNAIGILAIYKNLKWVEKTKTLFMCFAAGILISTPLIFALPAAIQKNPNAGFAALIGFLFMFFSNELIKRKTKQKTLAFGVTAIEGIGIHSFVDGVIYVVAFSSGSIIGILAGIGLVIHEFAEGVITFSVLRDAKIEAKKAVKYALLTATLTTPIGAFVAYPFVNQLEQSTLGLALGFVSGVLIYVSASHLLPEARKHEKEHSAWALLAGVALALFMVLIKTT